MASPARPRGCWLPSMRYWPCPSHRGGWEVDSHSHQPPSSSLTSPTYILPLPVPAGYPITAASQILLRDSCVVLANKGTSHVLGQGLMRRPPPPCTVTVLAILPLGALSWGYFRASHCPHIHPLSLSLSFPFRHLAIACPTKGSEKVISTIVREGYIRSEAELWNLGVVGARLMYQSRMYCPQSCPGIQGLCLWGQQSGRRR